MLGVTDSRKAAPGTIRAEFGKDQNGQCGARVPNSPETAVKEIHRFFSEERTLFLYLRKPSPHRVCDER